MVAIGPTAVVRESAQRLGLSIYCTGDARMNTVTANELRVDNHPAMFISSPGHGWLRISRNALFSLHGLASSISGCSFMDDGYVYLEQDSDVAKYLAALYNAGVGLPEVKYVHVEDPVEIGWRPFERNVPA